MTHPYASLRERYAKWDGDAVRWKVKHERWTGALLMTTVLGVGMQALSTLASPDRVPTGGGWAYAVPAIAAAAAAVNFTAAAVNRSARTAARQWISRRMGAEELKAEAFLYATGAGRYLGDEDEAVLAARLEEIDELVEDLQSEPVEPA